MDELLKHFQRGLGVNVGESLTPVVTIWEVVVGVCLAAVLTICVGKLYRRIHSEASYSQSLVHSFVLVGMITALIMILIGSNIARAFSLVGALSIIRFRTAIKSPLDVGFVFLAIAIGMACGTGFYAAAIVATMVIAVVMIALVRVNFGSRPERREFLLSVCFHVDTDYEQVLAPVLQKFFVAHSLAYVETVRQGTLREVVYSVTPQEKVSDKDIVDAITRINDNLKVTYRTVRHAVEVP